MVACGGGGGGFSTVTVAEDDAVRPRESVQVALTVIGPDAAPAVLSVAEFPLPEMLPPLAFHPLTVTGTLSGLVQEQLIVDEVPARTIVGLAEQDICGGFLGGSFTVKLAVQLAVMAGAAVIGLKRKPEYVVLSQHPSQVMRIFGLLVDLRGARGDLFACEFADQVPKLEVFIGNRVCIGQRRHLSAS